MAVIAYIVLTVIGLAKFAIIAVIIASWLVTFNILNPSQPFVSAVLGFFKQVTDPLLRPVQRYVPSLGGIDISPLVVLIGLEALRIGLSQYVFGPMIASGL